LPQLDNHQVIGLGGDEIEWTAGWKAPASSSVRQLAALPVLCRAAR